jgi:DDE family transposase
MSVASNAMCKFGGPGPRGAYHERWIAANSWRCPVDLEDFTIAVYCLVDELLVEVCAHPDWQRVRRRGPAPTLADSEVVTMEVVGEFLGLDQDAAIYRYFHREHPDWFPAVRHVHRTTFARQAANLWVVKERLWGGVRDRVPYDPALSFVDSVPTPVCRFGRAYGCRRFRGQAAFGRDTGSKATFYGFRHHLRICWPGLLTAVSVAPANIHDRDLVPELVAGAVGQVLGDRNYWDPKLMAELVPAGITLRAPFKKRASDPDPLGSRVLTQVRWRIETVASQLVERYHLKRLWARDAWHLTSRVLRKILSHTIAVLLCLERGYPPLQFAQLLD